MILITLSTFLSVIVINLYFRGDKKQKVPEWAKRVRHAHVAVLNLTFKSCMLLSHYSS